MIYTSAIKSIDEIGSDDKKIEHKHTSGLYNASDDTKKIYNQQPGLDPPSLFNTTKMTTKECKSHLDELARDNGVFVENCCKRILRMQTLQRNKKRKKGFDDEVELILEKEECELITSDLIREGLARLPLSTIMNYFTSPEVKSLLKPKKDEAVIGCLACQIYILTDAATNNDILVQLIKCDDPLTMTTKVRQYLRM